MRDSLMNDFTKEELQYIHDIISKRPAVISFDKHEILRIKIQAMIEGYNQSHETCCNKCNEEFRECGCKDE